MQVRRKKASLVILSLVVIATAGVLTYALLAQTGRKDGKAWQDAQERMRAAAGLRFDNISIPLKTGTFTVTPENGAQQTIELGESGQQLSIEQTDFLAELSFAGNPYTVEITAQVDGAVEWAGGLAAYGQFIPQKNDTYLFTVVAAFRGDGFEGACTYAFHVVYNAKTDFYLTKTTVDQGDTLLLVGTNVRTKDVTVTLDFDYQPYFIYNKAGCFGYIPINYMRETGQHKATVFYGTASRDLYYTVVEPAFDEQHLTVPESTRDATVNNDDAQQEYNAVMDEAQASFDDTIYWDQPFVQPVDGTITTEFGIKRYTNGAATPTRHAGIDIACDTGTPVAAANAGKVLFSGYLQMTGNTVIIEHGMGLHTIYLHMDALNCETGAVVDRGDTIGTVGMTGYATGPHLHFEMQIGGYCINPWSAFDGTSGLYDPQHMPYLNL